MYKNFFKRVIDLILSTLLFLIVIPVFLILICVLLINNRGSAFFFQKRPGKGGVVFKVIKFKTMNDRRDADGNLLPDEVRLTPLGKMVRKTSLDEIPQLLNVIRGEMSIIGPRPLLPEYLPLYDKTQMRRHDVRPGITGWAQVNGRNAISWQQKFDYDVWYVDHLSFALDVRIFVMTFLKVLKSEDVNSSTAATMERFQGNNITH